ncbi:MAG TPA: helix-turn-helix domain-containing protein [Actinomycetota bacterium]|nr:helix-turn-helix domain-containing protein [Actinomycetota bacterium]
MGRTDFGAMNCSIARTLDVVGERWALLVLRESFFGTRRFEDFLQRLGIARNVLSDRLDRLVQAGIMRKERYQDRPERFEYRLTEKGIALNDVVLAIKAWGDRWTDSAGNPPTVVRHLDCGQTFEAVPVCSECGGRVHARNVRAEPGPGATADDVAGWEERLEAAAARRASR